MFTNPMAKFFEKKPEKKVPPISILCVMNDERYLNSREVERIRGYCKNNGLGFRAREYNVDKYDMDMYIKVFPTYHLYYKGSYSESFDTTEEPIFKLKERVEEWEQEEKEKERRREAWEAKKKFWKRRYLGIEERPKSETITIPIEFPQQERRASV